MNHFLQFITQVITNKKLQRLQATQFIYSTLRKMKQFIENLIINIKNSNIYIFWKSSNVFFICRLCNG